MESKPKKQKIFSLAQGEKSLGSPSSLRYKKGLQKTSTKSVCYKVKTESIFRQTGKHFPLSKNINKISMLQLNF